MGDFYDVAQLRRTQLNHASKVISELRSEVARLTGELAGADQTIIDLIDELDDARAEIADLERKAQ